MGNCFAAKNRYLKQLVSFPRIVHGYVQGGDLIFIEELDFFDDYTRMNRQKLHYFKRALRTKQNMNLFCPIKQWCNVGIVVDSDIEDVKYILMLGKNGFIKTEYFSQVFQWKAERTTFAIRRLENPLSMAQSAKLRNLANFLWTMDSESGMYKDLFDLQEDQLQKINITQEEQSLKKKKTKSARHLKGNQVKVGSKGKGKDADLPMPSSDSETDSEEVDKMEQLNLVKNALGETRRILEELDNNGSLYAEFYEVFKMFCGKLTDDLDDDDQSVNWSQTSRQTLKISVDQSDVLEILAIPQFVKYFRVALDDENFFEATIERLSDLATVQHYVDNGLPFDSLINELQQADFFIGCEMTDREPNAVMYAQMMVQILEYLQIIQPTERELNLCKDVNDMDDIPIDESIRMGYQNYQFAHLCYGPTRTVQISTL